MNKPRSIPTTMAEPRFSLCSLPIGVFLPSVVSQFSSVPLQHLLPLWPRRLSPFYLFLSLPLKTFRPLTRRRWYTSLLATVYPTPSTHLASSCPRLYHGLSIQPTSIPLEIRLYETEGRFERDRYTELCRTGSHSMSNPDCVLCLLTRTS